MPPKKFRSPSTTPVPSTEPGGSETTHIPTRQWEGMKRVLDAIYNYRADEYVDSYLATSLIALYDCSKNS
jgi:chromatin structure-remodeling complex subunit RSC1/2